jgi:hypothetical protein
MAKHVGVQLPDELYNVLQKGTQIGVLATFSDKSVPSAVPIQWLYPKGRESILLIIHKEHASYHNMVWQKKVTFCFMAEHNIVYSVLGRAGVVRAPSDVNPLMNVVRIDIIEIQNEKSVLTTIDAGVQWKYTSPDARELGEALMEELKELASVL